MTATIPTKEKVFKRFIDLDATTPTDITEKAHMAAHLAMKTLNAL